MEKDYEKETERKIEIDREERRKQEIKTPDWPTI